MIERHPFKPFVPKNAKYLLLGSFPGRVGTRMGEWYYETRKGQFWTIIQNLYKVKLENREQKEHFFGELGIALSDVIYECIRTESNNSDNNLKVITYNIKIVNSILENNPIEKIYFSSRNVEKIFRSKFKDVINKYPRIKLITLPSSSPRYAKLSIKEKLKLFSALLPKR